MLRAALLIALGVGGALVVAAALAGPGAPPASTASPLVSPSAAATAAPAATASAVAVPATPLVVYFARPGLPPFRATALGGVPSRDTAQDRIGARLSALWGAQNVPAGAANPFAKSGRVGTQGQLGTEIRLDGDLATVTFDLLGGWGVTSQTESRGLYQQLVYTVTEEPGIRRALVKEKGRADAAIGTVTVTQPATREDVAGYSFSGTKAPAIAGDGTQVPEELTNVGVAIDTDILRGLPRGVVPGLARVGVDVRATGILPGGRLDPRFTATLERCDPPTCDGGKWTLAVLLPDVVWPTGRAPYAETFDRSPIRSVRAAEFQGGTVAVAIRLDDARPWRVATEPTGNGTARLYIDIGGAPSEVNEDIAVYVPTPEQGVGDRATGCTCSVEGAARVFEANVVWRVRDGNGREVSRGNTTASRGTSSVWGVFSASVTIPPLVSGTPTLEVFSVSPRDGSEQDVISIPLTLH